MTLPVDINGAPIHPGDTVALHAPAAAYADSPVKPPSNGMGTVAAYQADGVVVAWTKPQRLDGFTRADCGRFLEVKRAGAMSRRAA